MALLAGTSASMALRKRVKSRPWPMEVHMMRQRQASYTQRANLSRFEQVACVAVSLPDLQFFLRRTQVCNKAVKRLYRKFAITQCKRCYIRHLRTW